MPKTTAQNLHDLFLLKLKALYDVENELIKALPKLAKAASNKELKEGFQNHLTETRTQAKRLEEIFRQMNEKPAKTKEEAIRGLAKDAEWIIKNVKDPQTKDAALIAAAQYVEHYEMAGYGSARAWAELMGHAEAEELLAETLAEEEAADELLNKVATSEVNDSANTMVEEE